MNKVELQQTGGFPLETDTLSYLQDSFTTLQALAAIAGDNFILSGVAVVGANVTDGFIVLNGELLPFVGGGLQSKVIIREAVATRPFENGAVKDVFRTRHAEFGTGAGSVNFSDLFRIKNLVSFRNLPTEATSAIDSASEDTLATSKAVKLLNDKIEGIIRPGMIMIWSGTIGSIPEGWRLCDGVDNRPDLRDKFVLGAGNLYAVGQQGGEKEHILSIAEMPSHNHGFNTGDQNGRSDNANDRDVMVPGGSAKTTGNTGGGLAHNNMPPYYSFAYIIKI